VPATGERFALVSPADAKRRMQVASTRKAGTMSQWQRFVEDLFSRLDGPLHFRFIAQPAMAIIFAVIDGARDAKTGKPAYFWAILTATGHRKELLRECWKSVGKIFFIAVILDVIYQLDVHSSVYLGETITVSFILAILPYVLLRGPINRVIRLGKKKTIDPGVLLPETRR
jgi:hypothetical protein